MDDLFTSAAEIEASLRDAGVDARDAKALASRAKPYVRLVATKVKHESAIPLGATKIGGRPDLPQGMPWPWRESYPDAAKRIAWAEQTAGDFGPASLNESKDEALEAMREHLTPEQFADVAKGFAAVDFTKLDLGDTVADMRRTAEPAPLAFIAQVDLAAVWAAGPVDPDIPREGRLLFFYDIEQMPGGIWPGDDTGLRLIHDTSPPDMLVRTDPPGELKALATAHTPLAQACTLVAGVAPPFHGSPDWSACEIREKAEQAVLDWWSDLTDGDHDHRVGGHPLQIQNDMQITCALLDGGLDLGDGSAWTSKEGERLKTNAPQWLMLLQIASDKTAKMMWGDSGNLYVWIRRDALKALRFEDARVIFQCY